MKSIIAAMAIAIGLSACASPLAGKPGVSIGMSEKAVRYDSNWGEPLRINRTYTANGTSEQWVYRRYRGFAYLYFRDGRLTAIQQ